MSSNGGSTPPLSGSNLADLSGFAHVAGVLLEGGHGYTKKAHQREFKNKSEYQFLLRSGVLYE